MVLVAPVTAGLEASQPADQREGAAQDSRPGLVQGVLSAGKETLLPPGKRRREVGVGVKIIRTLKLLTLPPRLFSKLNLRVCSY